jgi:hypothetical protein
MQMRVPQRYLIAITSIVLAGFLVTTNLIAQEAGGDERSGLEDTWTIKLVTVGRGSELYYQFGHNGIIVEDDETGRGVFYDYGTFSFDQPGFYRNFAFGRLYYRLSVAPVGAAFHYIQSINRAIRIQTLNLSSEREKRIVDFLNENAKPENRVYLYHHYLDNCATRVRDVLDMALDGQLNEATSDPGRMTFRRHTRRYLHHTFVIDWFLMFLMGMNIDRPITVWDEMFLPFEIEKFVADFEYKEKDGNMVKLVADESVYYESHGHLPPEDEWKAHWPVSLLIGLFLAGFVYAGRALGHPQEAAVVPDAGTEKRSGAWAPFGAYLLAGVLVSVVGLLGTALMLIASFTDHSLTYYNMNLFYANPLTVVLAVFCFLHAADFLGKRLGAPEYSSRRKMLGRVVRILSGIMFAAGILSICLKVVPGMRQENWLSLAGILPLYLSLLLPV